VDNKVYILDRRDNEMDYIRQTISSDKLIGIFELPQVLRDKQVEVIILPVEKIDTEKLERKINMGFLDIPELPDSFFDPLPEEELQAWGL
jgi:hypothetical protein